MTAKWPVWLLAVPPLLNIVGASLVGAGRPIPRAEIVAQRAATRATPTRNPFPFNFVGAPLGPHDVRRLWHKGRPQGPPLRKTDRLLRGPPSPLLRPANQPPAEIPRWAFCYLLSD